MDNEAKDVPSPDERSGSSSLAETSFDDLLREVADRTHSVLDEQSRWKLLLDAVVTMGTDLDLDTLLSRIVESAGRGWARWWSFR
ncbi:hypothetical protein [Nocardioides jensenii]|uniref:hypothetical protein n=1 Tax=Nocardioides jensenii TaxID=1843 RepID=UPI00082AD2F6|nr:hypothetical protein [Nocardioides jensenii]